MTGILQAVEVMGSDRVPNTFHFYSMRNISMSTSLTFLDGIRIPPLDGPSRACLLSS